MIDPETARWLDGPALVEWLEARGVQFHDRAQHVWARNNRRWRAGSAAYMQTVDALLCDSGLMLHDLPDELWREAPSGRRRGRPAPSAPRSVEVSANVTLAERRWLKEAAAGEGVSVSEFIRRRALAKAA